MALSVVQTASIYNQLGVSKSVAFGVNVTVGNSILVCTDIQHGFNVSSVTDSQSNSYSLVKANMNSGDCGVEIWKADNVAAGATTVTVTWGATGSPGIGFGIAEIGGTGGTTLNLDQFNLNSGTTTNPTAGSITTVNNGDLIVAALAYTSSSTVTSAGTGFTIGTKGSGGAWEYQIQGSAGSVTAGFNNSSSGTFRTILLGLSTSAPPPPAAGNVQVIFMGW